MPDIGVVVALPREAATLGINGVRGVDAIRNGRLRVIVCGIGAQRAAAAARALLQSGVGALVSWGVAGGLASDLQPGDLVLAGSVSSTDGTVRTDATWRERLGQALRGQGLGVRDGALWSAASAVASILGKQELATDGYIAVDMEASGIAHAARAGGVPFIAVKAISDPATRALPAEALRWLREDGRLRPFALARGLMRGPRIWAALRDMRADFTAACAGLRRAADVLEGSWPP